MRRKDYEKPQVSTLFVEMDCPLMAGSVVEQNSVIKATNQEVNYVDFSDDTTFDINWE